MKAKSAVQVGPAGSDLDELVFVRVMGWERHAFHYPGDFVRPEAWQRYEKGRHMAHLIRNHEWTRGDHVPKYSTDIAAAWQVVEKLKERAQVHLLGGPDDEGGCEEWTCGIMSFGYRPFQDQKWNGRAETAPLAICRAALATLHTPAQPK